MSLIEIQDPFHVPSNAEAFPAENVLIDSCDDHNAMNYWLPELGATNASFVLNRNCHGATYWLASHTNIGNNEDEASFVLDFGAVVDLGDVLLKNTANGHLNDR